MTEEPNYFHSIEECKKAELLKYNKNIRYKQLTQRIFTVGDKDQFLTYKHRNKMEEIYHKMEEITFNRWSGYIPFSSWIKYKNLTSESVHNTFSYIFHKFKKGIFVKIQDNQLSVFLPFSNVNYVNEWGHKIIAERHKNMVDYLVDVGKQQGFKVIPQNIYSNTKYWYANNGLLRYENPFQENDKGVCALKDMFTVLCRTRVVPDLEFFINKRDFPILTRKETEPYENIFGSNQKLLSHRYDSYCPILSACSTELNADIAIPTAEDWSRARNQEDNVFFPDFCRSYRYDFSTPWESRKSVAVFRGSSTGDGITCDTNPRLKIASMKNCLLDSGITKWNLRIRKQKDDKFVSVLNPQTLPFGLIEPLTPYEQSKFKYVVNVDGHVSAFRLSLELSFGSTLLLVESKYKMWFRDYLKEYVHYVPVKEDLSDLYEKIRWCQENDELCKQIAENARNFYNTYLLKDGILDYMKCLLDNLKDEIGDYFYLSTPFKSRIILKQQKILSLNKLFAKKENLKIIYYQSNIFFHHALRSYFLKTLVEFSSSARCLYSSKNTVVFLSMIEDIPVVVKHAKNNRDEMINEAFIGVSCINRLLEKIPNFRYTFHYDNDYEWVEYIDAITFQEYIKKESLTKIINIFLQLCLALAVAQENCNFIHNDITPWNILIKKVPKQIVTYQFKQYLFTVETNEIPVLIDYGKSHVVYKNFQYGFDFNFAIDPFSMIIRSLYEYDFQDETKIVKILSYFDQVENAKIFLEEHRKYNDIIYKEKPFLKNKDSIGLFLHLSCLGDLTIKQINYPEKMCPSLQFNSLFYFDLLIGKDPYQDILDYIMEYRSSELSQKNLVLYVNDYFSILLIFVSLFYFIKTYGDKISNTSKLKRMINTVIESFDTQLILNENLPKNLPISYINQNRNIERSKLSLEFETFSIPSKILTILQSLHKKEDNKMIIYQEMFSRIILYDINKMIHYVNQLPDYSKDTDTIVYRSKELISVSGFTKVESTLLENKKLLLFPVIPVRDVISFKKTILYWCKHSYPKENNIPAKYKEIINEILKIQ